MRTHKSLLRLMAGCLGVLLLQACGPLHVRDADRNAWVPIQTAAVEIHRDIIIPGERSRIFFQNGGPVRGINEFQPFCWLEVTSLAEHARTVRPGTFTVTRVGTTMKEVVEAAPVIVASLGDIVVAQQADDGDSGPTRITWLLSFRLHSSTQPDVRSLVCGGAFDDPRDADPSTIQEIAASLGEYATLRLR